LSGISRFSTEPFDVFDPGLAHRTGDDTGPAGEAGQQAGGLVQGLVETAAPSGQPRINLAPLLGPEVADLQQAVDEQPQAGVGGNPPRRGVRRAQQPRHGEVLHRIADRCGGQGDACLRQGPRADRVPGFQIGFDNAPEDVAGALVHCGQTDGEGLGAYRLTVSG